MKGIFLGEISSGKQWLLRGVGGDAEYSDGYALFRIGSAFTDEGQNLYAQRLDLLRHRLAGPLYPVAQNITHPGNLSSYSVSEDGRLVYHAAREEQYAIWMDRTGKHLDSLPPGPYWTLAISHDGTRVALGGYGLLVYDDARKVVSRLAPGNDRYLSFPVWAPGDAAVAADSTASEDIWRYDVASGSASPLLASSANQREGRLSPDGRWIAYQSDETGTDEVYVRPYPGEGTPVRVSTAGGGSPRWRADGRELCDMGADRTLELADPAPLFAPGVRRDPLAESATIYDVAPDGKRFLVLGPEPGATAPLTWFSTGPACSRGATEGDQRHPTAPVCQFAAKKAASPGTPLAFTSSDSLAARSGAAAGVRYSQGNGAHGSWRRRSSVSTSARPIRSSPSWKGATR